MNAPYYLKYFYFIARNWNIKLAIFTIYYEIKGERKYHINTIEMNDFQHEKIQSNHLAHASIYQASNYYMIEKAFGYLKKENVINNIIDFGSGKGRIMVVAANFGFKKITGIDFSESLCREAEANIEKIKASFPATYFKVVCGDAFSYAPDNDDNVFFFFNPFDEIIMLQVVKNILYSIKQNPRKVLIVYLNPLYKEIFLSAGFEEEYSFRKMEYQEFSILSKDSGAD
ncbi:MAG: class I SAM-dependent methyltransferase [Ginsengibacter sp.]